MLGKVLSAVKLYSINGDVEPYNTIFFLAFSFLYDLAGRRPNKTTHPRRLTCFCRASSISASSRLCLSAVNCSSSPRTSSCAVSLSCCSWLSRSYNNNVTLTLSTVPPVPAPPLVPCHCPVVAGSPSPKQTTKYLNIKFGR